MPGFDVRQWSMNLQPGWILIFANRLCKKMEHARRAREIVFAAGNAAAPIARPKPTRKIAQRVY
jgi:hypothetical protein